MCWSRLGQVLLIFDHLTPQAFCCHLHSRGREGHEQFPPLCCCCYFCLWLSLAPYQNTSFPFPCSLFLLHLFTFTWALRTAGEITVAVETVATTDLGSPASGCPVLTSPTYLWRKQVTGVRTTNRRWSHTEITQGRAVIGWIVSPQESSVGVLIPAESAECGLIWNQSLGSYNEVIVGPDPTWPMSLQTRENWTWRQGIHPGRTPCEDWCCAAISQGTFRSWVRHLELILP
jgi:hypothetical protein